MKKLRIFAFVAMIIVALAVFTGCDKLKTEDVEADPAKYVMDGMKLTLSETPLAPVAEMQDKVAYELKMKGQANTAELGVFLDTSEKKGSIDYSASVDYGDGYTDETAISLYYEDKQIVLESDMLEDVLETDAVGVDLGFTYKELEKSGIFGLLGSNGLITEENSEMIEKLIGKDGLGKTFTELSESIEKLSKEQYKFEDVKEETVTVGEKEVKVIVVSAKLNKDALVEIIEGIADSVKDIAKASGAKVTDKEIKEYISTIKDSMPEMSGEYKYYLSKKTGALVKIEGESKNEIYDKYFEDTETTKVSVDMTFGEDPTKLFLPSFKYEQSQKSEYVDHTLVLEAESRIEDGKFIMEGNGTSEYSDEKDEVEFTLELSDSEFTLTGKGDDDEEYSIEGEIESSEKEFSVKLDLSEAYGKDEEAAVEKIEFSVTYGEDVPEMPEYKNILDFSVDEVTDVMQNLYGAYVPDMDDSYGELEAPDEETVRYYLDNYEMLGCESVDEAIDLLRDVYGEDLAIPEEYLKD